MNAYKYAILLKFKHRLDQTILGREKTTRRLIRGLAMPSSHIVKCNELLKSPNKQMFDLFKFVYSVIFGGLILLFYFIDLHCCVCICWTILCCNWILCQYSLNLCKFARVSSLGTWNHNLYHRRVVLFTQLKMACGNMCFIRFTFWGITCAMDFCDIDGQFKSSVHPISSSRFQRQKRLFKYL